LSASELEVLAAVANNGSKTASALSDSISLPRSTFWFNLRKLDSKNLLVFGDGKSVVLTPLGQLVGQGHQKVLGIIGGFGPDTSAKFQHTLIKRFQKEFGDLPKVILVNENVTADAENSAVTGNTAALKKFLIDGAKTLRLAGVSTVVVPCNTAHVFIEDIRNASEVEVISIIEETAKVVASKFKKVGLLATSSTINSELFHKELDKSNVDLVLPSAENQKKIDEIINSILRLGKSALAIDLVVRELADALINRGAEAILLACTDLQFIDFGDIPVIDSLQILEDAAFKKITRGSAESEIPRNRSSLNAPRGSSMVDNAERSSASFDALRQKHSAVTAFSAHPFGARKTPGKSHSSRGVVGSNPTRGTCRKAEMKDGN